MLKGKPVIFIISPFSSPNLGGVESHIDKLMAYCKKRDYYPMLITYQPLTRKVKGIPHEYGEGYEIHRATWFGHDLFNKFEKYFPIQFLYLTPGLFVYSLYYYLKYYRDIQCVHAHGLTAGFITRVLAQLIRKRSVISTHAVYNFEDRKTLAFFVRYILYGFDVILAVSEVSRQELIKLDIPPDKIKVHPNWIDTSVFKPLDVNAEPANTDKSYRLNLLYVGRLIDKKGVLLILESAKYLPDVAFHIVGSGPLEEQVRSASETLSNIKSYGALMQYNKDEYDKLLRLYAISDYFVSPYLYDEGFSTTLIESVACGTQVIVPKRGSPPTFLNDTVAIYLDAETSTANIVQIVKGLKPKSDASIKSCVEFASENFGFKNADIIVDTYKAGNQL